jgi:hypothetical protein
MIRVEVDVIQAIAALQSWKVEELPFATSKAINDTANDVVKAEKLATQRVFMWPTPRTMDSTMIAKRSTKSQLWADLKLRDSGNTPPSKYLLPEIYGGLRPQKRSERSLQFKFAGKLVYAVPSRNVRLDAYGNVPGSFWTKVLSALSLNPYALPNPHKPKGRGRKAAQYFIGSPANGLYATGVYERTATGIRPIFFFISPPKYKARFDWSGIAIETIRSNFIRNFNNAMQFAMSTSRYK